MRRRALRCVVARDVEGSVRGWWTFRFLREEEGKGGEGAVPSSASESILPSGRGEEANRRRVESCGSSDPTAA